MISSRPGAIYQQDNARPHTARLSQQCLQGYDDLPWPARHRLEGAGDAAPSELTKESEWTRDAEVENPGLRKRSNRNSGRVWTHHPLFTKERRIDHSHHLNTRDYRED
ncbi:hypothetical protein TNCV_1504361 [Trichonephila clavipes]|uniref:Uncharacterized protein n=1 Tax=Trichonephila clavipes TaxID=2585209 RepID=A0A8X6RRB6_TRICX|nr:hypothetical protein TNCV_1504361 [Trichonephila clavipes]